MDEYIDAIVRDPIADDAPGDAHPLVAAAREMRDDPKWLTAPENTTLRGRVYSGDGYESGNVFAGEFEAR